MDLADGFTNHLPSSHYDEAPKQHTDRREIRFLHSLYSLLVQILVDQFYVSSRRLKDLVSTPVPVPATSEHPENEQLDPWYAK
jgi:hypothetical protein